MYHFSPQNKTGSKENDDEAVLWYRYFFTSFNLTPSGSLPGIKNAATNAVRCLIYHH